jgi:hypothetical protein
LLKAAVALALVCSFFILSSSTTSSVNDNEKQYEIKKKVYSRKISNDRIVLDDSDVDAGDSNLVYNTEMLKAAYNGSVGFLDGVDYDQELSSVSFDDLTDPVLKFFYQNLKLRKTERENWGVKTYSTRIACLIPIGGKDDVFGVARISSNYGPLCDRLIFFIPKDLDEDLVSMIERDKAPNSEIITVNNRRPSSKGGSDNLWERVHLMWNYLATEYPYSNEIDWYVKVEVRTLLSVHTLRNFVKYYDPEVFHYIGHTVLYQGEVNVFFNSASCYILSSSAMHALGSHVKNLKAQQYGQLYSCGDKSGAGEDSLVSICLKEIGIHPENTVDSKGRQRFLLFRYGGLRIFQRKERDWYWRYKPSGFQEMEDCCVEIEDVISENGFGDNERDSREYRRLFRRQERWHSSQDSSTTNVPPVAEFFFYNPSELGKLDKYGNIARPPGYQNAFKGIRK